MYKYNHVYLHLIYEIIVISVQLRLKVNGQRDKRE